MKLVEYLSQKELEYRDFDPRRAPVILNQLSINNNHLAKPKCKVIQILGTNGKGSTGRFLALLLKSAGYSVGHFTSPHLVTINERFWLNGNIVDDDTLDKAFNMLNINLMESASYFEVLTYVALSLFHDCDYFICEAGIGGEFDSTTTCIDSHAKVFTKIDYDHTDRLGNTIEDIAYTKLRAINSSNKCMIVGLQKYNIVYDIAKEISNNNNVKLRILNGIPCLIKDYCNNLKYPIYQQENLALACTVFDELGFKVDNFLNKIPRIDLLGRMQKIADNVYLDVGHNVSGAYEILKNFSDSKFVFIYNSYLDKKPEEILKVLYPIIKRVEIFNIEDNPRVIDKNSLCNILDSLGIEYTDFHEIDKQEDYIVCGSFSVVGEFLKNFNRYMK